MRMTSFLAIFALASSVAAQIASSNHIEAVVNDKVVTYVDIMEEFREREIPYAEMSETEKEIEYEQMLVSTVLEILHQRAVKEAGVEISEEDLLNAQQAERERQGFASREAFATFLQAQGQTEDDWNREFRRDQETAAWLKVLSGSGAGGVKKLSRALRPRYNIAVSPREIRKFYNEKKKELYTLKDEAVVRVIQVYFSEAKRGDKARKKQRMLGLKRKLETKADFKVLAAKHSDHVTKETGGLIGKVEKGEGDQLPEPVEEALFDESVKAGDIIGPISHVNSWWLIQCESCQQARVVPFTEAQAHARALLRSQKQRKAIKIIQLELVKRAHITPARLKRKIMAELSQRPVN